MRLPILEASGELWINGDLIRRFGRFEASNAIVWQGYLSAGDTVEMRMRSLSSSGSRLRLTLTAITETASLSYPVASGCYVAGSSDTLLPVTSGLVAATFSATPAGLSINTNTGAIDLAASSSGNYTVTYSGTSVCGTSISANKTITLVGASGNPVEYGAGVWNVYAYNAGTVSGTPWASGYAGYYVATGLNFNTNAEWNQGTSPSQASGYQGCSVGNDNHSWRAKRAGFPCGFYTLSVPDHDDDVELWVNGVRVFQHTGYGDNHDSVWSGALGPNDSIEFRAADGVGGSYGILTFTQHPTYTYSSWTGAVDSDWTNAGNWCGPVPTATTDVAINAGSNQPIVLAGMAAHVRNLTVRSGAALTTLGTLNLYGNLQNRGGTLDLSQGRLDLEGGSTQQVPAFVVQA
ncbi:MAG: hypothetical protein EOP50_16710, partial [Sphingobacteriales bacterium]